MPTKIPQSPFTTRLSGSAKETELRLRNIFQWQKKRPPIPLFILTIVVLMSCFGLVSCRVEEPSADHSITTSAPDIEEPPAETVPSQPDSEDPIFTAQLTGLTLDESGQGDDTLTVLTYEPDWSNPGGRPEAIVRLGSGAELSCELPCESRSHPVLQAGHLTDPTRQSVLICLESTTSNYGYARYCILEVIDGTLELFDLTAVHSDWETRYGFEIASLPYTEFSCVHIPLLGRTKEERDWVTLAWSDGQWKETTDLYYSETHTLAVVGGRELTLCLSGTLMEGRDSYYCLNKLKLFDGYDLFQTIDPNAIVYEGDHLFEGLYINAGGGAYGDPDIRDINFDGSDDVGFLCAAAYPKNIPYAYFLWDENTEQLVFTCVLFAEVELDTENHQLIEQIVGSPAGIYDQYDTYEFDADGQLDLIDSEIIYRT